MPYSLRSVGVTDQNELPCSGLKKYHTGEVSPIVVNTMTLNNNIQPPPGLSAIKAFNSMKAMYSITKRYSAVLTVTFSVMMFGIGLLTPVQAQDPQPYLPKVA
ncbi:MAG TPA: hypothetical protein PLL64_07420, partial [Rhodothermales bacterium]|nr:hypothetical protein [Rhodothermales bacterium]